MVSWQKDQYEVNNEFIRSFFPKGTCFYYTQEKVNMMMNNINSYKRAKLENNTPYAVFERKFKEYTVFRLNILKLTVVTELRYN